MRREARFPAGLVTAHLRVKQGCIQAVRFYGDFFGSGPLEELEAAMAGLPLDAQLAEALAPLHVEHYMSGITAEELARLLRG
ncbi:MAG: lipoate protein ligase C-terminal domain-containing protein [Flavonifractor plautii]